VATPGNSESPIGTAAEAPSLSWIFLAGALVLAGAAALVRNSATWVHGWNGWVIAWVDALLLCFGLALALRRLPAIRCGPTSGLLALLSLSIAVSCLAADSIANSLAAAVPLACLIGLAVLAARTSPAGLGRIVAAVSAWGVVLCAVSLWRWLMQDIAAESARVAQINGLLGEQAFHIDWPEIRNGHPFGHQNYLAGAILLLIPVWLGQATSDRRWIKLTALFGLGLGFLTLWSTQTRAAAPALAVMLGMVLVWTAVRRVWSPKVWTLWLVLGGAAIGALIATNVRNQDLSASGEGVAEVWRVDVRHQMLAAGRLLLRGHEWTGIGPGAVPGKYPSVRGRIDAGLEANYQLHNTPLQLVVELGWPALLALLSLLATTFVRWWRAPLDPASRGLPPAVWPGIAVFGYAVYSLTDYQLDVTAIACLLGLAIGLVWNGSTPAEPVRVSGPRPDLIAHGCAVLLLGSALVATAWVGRARWSFHQANAALMRADSATFLQLAARAHEQDPSDPFYPEKIAAWHIESLSASTNATRATVESAAAAHWLKASLKRSSSSEYAHFNLGWLLLAEEPGSALEHFRQAAHLVPDRKGVYLGCALALSRLERPEQATECLALELVLDPGFLAASTPWKNEPLASLKKQAVHRAATLLIGASAEAGAANPNGRWFREKAAFLTWFAGGSAPAAKDRGVLGDFWGTLDGTNLPAPKSLAAEAPWILVQQAWKEPSAERAKHLLAAAAYRSSRTIPPDDTLNFWLNRVRLATWSDVVRSDPAWELISGYRRQRTGYNLIARQAEGARPADIPTYEENVFFETFFRFLAGTRSDVPSPVMLRELDRIIASVPTETRR
jgi:O-antigen ligase/tetratricopeptide (TPR) repeat protein